MVLSQAAGMLRSGASPDDAWGRLGWGPVRNGVPAIPGTDHVAAAVRAACALAHRTGAPLSSVLDVIISHATEYLEARSAVAIAMAGPRMSATVLQWLPAAGLGLAAIIDPRAVRLLITTPVGWMLVVIAAGLTAAGRRWMAGQMRRALSAGHAPAGSHAESVMPTPLVMGLADAALVSGADITTTLRCVGDVIDDRLGADLRSVATRLADTGDWRQAWHRVSAELEPLEGALRHAWLHGMDPATFFDITVDHLRRQHRHDSKTAVESLQVSLSFPLTLCFLPAFALVGVVPMILAVAATTTIALA